MLYATSRWEPEQRLGFLERKYLQDKLFHSTIASWSNLCSLPTDLLHVQIHHAPPDTSTSHTLHTIDPSTSLSCLYGVTSWWRPHGQVVHPPQTPARPVSSQTSEATLMSCLSSCPFWPLRSSSVKWLEDIKWAMSPKTAPGFAFWVSHAWVWDFIIMVVVHFKTQHSCRLPEVPPNRRVQSHPVTNRRINKSEYKVNAVCSTLTISYTLRMTGSLAMV